MKVNLLSFLKLILLEGKIVVYSQKASKVTSFLMTLVSFFPGALCFGYSGSKKINFCQKAWSQLGLPLKIFHRTMSFLPLATLKDLGELERKKGFLVGSTNILIPTTPSL